MTKMVCPCCGEIYAVGIDVQVGRKVSCGKCQQKHIYYNYALVPFAIELAPKGNDRRIACPHCRQHFYIDKSNLGEYSCSNCKALFYVSEKPEVFAPGVQADLNIPVIPAATPDPIKLPSEAFVGCSTKPLFESPLNLPDDILPGGDVISMPAATKAVTACINDPVPPPVSEPVQSAKTVCINDPVPPPVSEPVQSAKTVCFNDQVPPPVSEPVQSAETVCINDPVPPPVSEPSPSAGNDVIRFKADVPEVSVSEQARQIVKLGLRRERSGFSGMLINLAEKICGK
ncbi:MAG: hypothetical protein E7042_06665 [Lentisphaerae bacterium]|nr:hypothetical protein [Lentisphaerota bacterium]